MEFSLNVGVQFGLTDATSDTALKFRAHLLFKMAVSLEWRFEPLNPTFRHELFEAP